METNEIPIGKAKYADYYQLHNVVMGCFPAENMHPCDYEDLHNRLADLIDPEGENDD